jgi:hypothetical protein
MSTRGWLCRASIASLSLSLAVACGGDDDDDVTLVDSGNSADCPAPASLGSFEPEEGAMALHFTQSPPEGQPEDPNVRFLSVVADVTQGEPPPELLVIQLWDGFGAFEGGEFAAGEFSFSGPEVTVNTCGVCVFLLANAALVGGQLQFDKQYIATGGNITVEDIGERAGGEITGSYAGTITDMTLSEVDPASSDGSALSGGCQSTIDEISWDAAIINGDEGG